MADVGGALESIRVQAVNRGKGNQKFRELNMATLELLLPRDSRKVWIPAPDENPDQQITFIQKETTKTTQSKKEPSAILLQPFRGR